jgi:hypothetical protein
VVQFETKRRTLPGLDMLLHALRKRGSLRGCNTAAAWLSSALVVRCSLKWGIERNPYSVLYITGNCLSLTGEEGEDDVKSAWCLCPGRHTSYNGCYSGLLSRKVELIPKKYPQFGLWAEIRPHEVGIGSNRGSADRGEYVLRSCTI